MNEKAISIYVLNWVFQTIQFLYGLIIIVNDE